jgi:hypothetical protein
MIVGTGVIVLGLRYERAFVSAYGKAGLAGLAVGAVLGLLLQRVLLVRPGMALGAGCSLALRFCLAMTPGFSEMDLDFHTHRLQGFREGRLIYSGVQSPLNPGGAHLAIPYPPALYASVAPFAKFWNGGSVLRAAMVILEDTAPFLIWFLVRALGGSQTAAGMGLVAAAVMPEGLLVLVKGIAANIFGQWATLLALVVFSWGGASLLLLTATSALVFLAHPGAAICFALLLAGWIGSEARNDPSKLRHCGWLLLGLGIGAVTAWLTYYREVGPLVATAVGAVLRTVEGGSGPTGVATAPLVKWAVLGKVGQNVVLKFGLGPFLIAMFGLSLRAVPPRLERLIRVWLALVGALLVAAVVSPAAVRFEYFAVPAVAMLAGLGAERLLDAGRGHLVSSAWWMSATVQVIIGGFHLFGRFAPWSVIIPAHWEPPFRLGRL